jgi:uncharacterized OB-fold protein
MRLLTPVRLEFEARAGRDLARFLAGIAERRFLGRRCPSCSKVYLPPRGACPMCGVAMGEEVAVADTGTVTTFCIVNVPVEGRKIDLPYVYGSILLDGADLAFAHLVIVPDALDVRMGMRVAAVWSDVPGATMESILGFRPTGEPDAPPEVWKGHV